MNKTKNMKSLFGISTLVLAAKAVSLEGENEHGYTYSYHYPPYGLYGYGKLSLR